MPLAKLSSKSQIVLPVQIRKRLDLHPGQLLEIGVEGNSIVLRKGPTSFVDELDRCAADFWNGYWDELREDRNKWHS